MSGPGYWMHETSGVLRPAIEAYLNHAPLSGEQIATLRAYLRQWIMASVWDENPHATAAERVWLIDMRMRIEGLTTRQAITAWLDDVIDAGLDPL